MTQYADPGDVETYLRSTITADFSEIDAATTVASSIIENMCARTFVVPTAATTRTFVPSHATLLKIDDLQDDTDLVITEDGVTVTDYQLEIAPGRATQRTPTGELRPWAYVRRLTSAWTSTAEATVSVTGWFGWSAVPDDVVLATKMIAKDLLSMRDTRFGFVQVGEFSRRVAENGMVVALLTPYRSADAWGIA